MESDKRTQAIVDALAVDYRRQILKCMLSKNQGLSIAETARVAMTGFSRTRHHFEALVKAGLITPRFWRPVRGVHATIYIHADEAISHPMANAMLGATVLWPKLEAWQPEGNDEDLLIGD